MKPGSPDSNYSEKEIARRRDELAKRMLNMPPKPLKPKLKDGMKVNPEGKSRRT
jgi:hypothetical protein